jgi:hypothetical protein
VSRGFRASLASVALLILAWRSYAFRWVLWPAMAVQRFLSAPSESSAAVVDMSLLALCVVVWGAAAYLLMTITDPRR